MSMGKTDVVKLFSMCVMVISLISASVLAFVPNPGHPWNQTECDNTMCVNSSSGNVGIGTTSPVGKLDIVGNANATGYLYGMAGLCISSDCRTAWPTAPSGGWVVSENYLYNNTAGVNVGIGTSSPVSLLSLYQPGQNTLLNASNGTINAGLYVGTVQGGAGASIGTNSNHRFNIFTNGTDRLTVDTSGNVGIGTASPDVKLTLSSNSWVGDLLKIYPAKDTSSNYYLKLSSLNPTSQHIDYRFVAYDVAGGAEKDVLYFDSSTGNVGIGTTTPQTKLDVAGATSTNTLKILSPTTTVANSVTQVSVNSPGGWAYNTSAWSYTGIDLTAGTWIVQYTAYLQWVYPMPYMVGYLNFGLGNFNYQSSTIPYTVATCANPGDQTISGLFIANLTSTQNLNVTLTIYGGDQNCPYYCSISCTTQLNLVKKGVGNDNSKASIMINAIKLG